jgi:hypothetical protein
VLALPEVKRDTVLEQFQQVLKGYHTLVPILDPEVKHNTKGRPSLKQKRQDNTTTRNPSSWEMVDQSYAPKPKRGRPRKNPARKTTRGPATRGAQDTSDKEQQLEGDAQDVGNSGDEDAEGSSEEDKVAGEVEQAVDEDCKSAMEPSQAEGHASKQKLPAKSPSIDVIGPPQDAVKPKCRQCGNNAHQGGIWLCPKHPHVKVSVNPGDQGSPEYLRNLSDI